MVQLVSFDIWGTLLRSNAAYRKLQRKVIRDAIGFTGTPKEFHTLAREVYAEIDRDTEQSGRHFGMTERLLRITARSGTTMPSQEALVGVKSELTELQRAHMPHMTEPGLPELFRTLKASGKLLAVICNTNMTDGAVVHEALAHHGLAPYLDEEIYSNEIGIAKPDPQIFAALAQRFQIDREQIVHVGDNPITDVQGATTSGFGAILYDRRQRVPQSSAVIWRHDDLPPLLG